MIKQLIEKLILPTLLGVDLTSVERKIVEESIREKYIKAIRSSLLMGLFAILPIIFLDTTVIISVLIPITMVAGSAWFAISLASLRQKFERFGMELTTNMFEAFASSLLLLFLLSLFSLAEPLIGPWSESLPYQQALKTISFLLGTVLIGNIIYKIFIGSFKYDINDAMLTGQSEAAERYYRQALSLLHDVSDNLMNKKSIQVANYYIGVAFFEVFSYLKEIKVDDSKLTDHIQEGKKLIFSPSMSQDEADKIALKLIAAFANYCVNPTIQEAKKNLQAIDNELKCLEQNKDEDQEMVDTRLAVIFREIASLIEDQGETLFHKR